LLYLKLRDGKYKVQLRKNNCCLGWDSNSAPSGYKSVNSWPAANYCLITLI